MPSGGIRNGAGDCAQVGVDWAARIGPERFGQLRAILQDLIAALDG